jgi:transposase
MALMCKDVIERDEKVVIIQQCIHCGGETEWPITYEQWNDWQVKHKFIQEVFPEMSVDDRETMMNGTHPSCFNEIFKDMD